MPEIKRRPKARRDSAVMTLTMPTPIMARMREAASELGLTPSAYITLLVSTTSRVERVCNGPQALPAAQATPEQEQAAMKQRGLI